MAKTLDFCWQGITKRKDHWKDGLWAAMQILEKEYDVRYIEPTDELKGDIVLYWEAPVTRYGPYSANYERIRNHSGKSVLLFAGGPLKKADVDGFDIVAVESKINAEECATQGIPYETAFGVNTDIFKPMKLEKKWKTVTHGTSASWKRQWLVCEAMGKDALVFGQRQTTDTRPFIECEKCGSTVFEEVTYGQTAQLLNQAEVSVNCADYWGGGQRATLEAMACGLPVIVMKDSPKNREFVEDSGFGQIVDPDPNAIKEAVERATIDVNAVSNYVKSKWSHKQYAKSLKNIITRI